ncbi:MAG TPA: hypothetical protein VK209_11405 [Candidatus Sulfotelmatobacter sp.]|nr:hypothetical protein [Candidatus Sulfotelmatobacter sp.]
MSTCEAFRTLPQFNTIPFSNVSESCSHRSTIFFNSSRNSCFNFIILARAAANGYLIGAGVFDGNLYALGKGKTETTVSAPLTTVTAGTNVLIQGTVMDMSPAAPNTPAISDEDMSEWMDYLHMQNATLQNNPPVPTGVTVKLSAVGPNGNAIDIGTVISNSGGSFSEIWTPPTEGKYTVYATFDGSNSYYGSYAQTALGN